MSVKDDQMLTEVLSSSGLKPDTADEALAAFKSDISYEVEIQHGLSGGKQTIVGIKYKGKQYTPARAAERFLNDNPRFAGPKPKQGSSGESTGGGAKPLHELSPEELWKKANPWPGAIDNVYRARLYREGKLGPSKGRRGGK